MKLIDGESGESENWPMAMQFSSVQFCHSDMVTLTHLFQNTNRTYRQIPLAL